MKTQKQKYKEMIEENAYITFEVVTEFLRKGMIADLELVANIFDKGMSVSDYQNLQEALDELNIEDVE